MDGGGHDHGGHGVQVGHHGDSGGSVIHDHGHDHGHGGQHHHGGEGLSLSSILGLNDHHHGHNFLSHLLGLDHDSHHHHHGQEGAGTADQHEHGHQQPHITAQPIWSSALQSMKLSNALQGIVITPSVWLLLLFTGFVAWLFVIYWIRHHEPLINAVIGTGAAQSATAGYDRKMMAGIKDAFPVRTRGELYCPSPPPIQAPNAELGPGAAAGTASRDSTASYYTAPTQDPLYQPQQPYLQPAQGYSPYSSYGYQYPVGSAPVQAFSSPAPSSPDASPSAMQVPVRVPTGPRVRTIVNR